MLIKLASTWDRVAMNVKKGGISNWCNYGGLSSNSIWGEVLRNFSDMYIYIYICTYIYVSTYICTFKISLHVYY